VLLNTLFFIIDGLLLALLYIQHPTLSLWWLAPLCLGLYLTIGIAYILLLVTVGLLLPKKTPSHKVYTVYRAFIVHTLRWVLLLLGVRYTVSGTDRLPTDRPFLLISNHRCAFDPLITLAAFNKWSITFIAKPGVFNIPAIGAIMRRVCFLPIDRENARNAVTTIKQAAGYIADKPGISVGIYPEGTRSKDGTLLPFHAGSFKIATIAQCPVAVASIRMEKGRFGLPRRMELRILDVMDAAYVSENNTATLASRAETSIRADLGQ